jgi:hypothetical protein
MLSFRPTLISLLMTLCALVGIVQAADLQQAQATMDRYLTAQSQWQDNLAALLIKDRPKFTATANAQRDHQHAMIALKRARFNYLIVHHPGRLDTGELGRFTNFTWTEADTAAAKASDTSYTALEEQVTRTRAINDAQPDWDAFRYYFQTEISQSEEFKVELSRFQAELEKIKRDGEMK